MYLHIGNHILCDDRDLIGIFDLDNLTASRESTEFLEQYEKNQNLINIGGKFDLPKSLILIQKGDKEILYMSPITSSTLYKRSKNPTQTLL